MLAQVRDNQLIKLMKQSKLANLMIRHIYIINYKYHYICIITIKFAVTFYMRNSISIIYLPRMTQSRVYLLILTRYMHLCTYTTERNSSYLQKCNNNNNNNNNTYLYSAFPQNNSKRFVTHI